MSRPPTRNRPPMGSRESAEAAFKSATTKPPEEPPAKAPPIPGPTELVSLRIPREILEHFQEDGPGWQDRIVAALRKAASQ
ncbi:MAG TPA: BrnA antitoxin family protein [Beijerinckiaceae bacterium]